MMLAVREAKLALSHRMTRRIASGGDTFEFHFVLSLSNAGLIPAVAPYIKIQGASVHPMGGEDGPLTRRNLHDGTSGVYASRDVLIHVEDVLDIAFVRTGLQMRRIVVGANARETAASIIESGDADTFTVAPFDHLRGTGVVDDQLIKGTVTFGAENVPVHRATISLDKWTMFTSMVAQLR
jgi:hypothetical protein